MFTCSQDNLVSCDSVNYNIMQNLFRNKLLDTKVCFKNQDFDADVLDDQTVRPRVGPNTIFAL